VQTPSRQSNDNLESVGSPGTSHQTRPDHRGPTKRVHRYGPHVKHSSTPVGVQYSTTPTGPWCLTGSVRPDDPHSDPSPAASCAHAHCGQCQTCGVVGAQHQNGPLPCVGPVRCGLACFWPVLLGVCERAVEQMGLCLLKVLRLAATQPPLLACGL
jgi:hypothetical protein